MKLKVFNSKAVLVCQICYHMVEIGDMICYVGSEDEVDRNGNQYVAHAKCRREQLKAGCKAGKSDA